MKIAFVGLKVADTELPGMQWLISQRVSFNISSASNYDIHRIRTLDVYLLLHARHCAL